MTKNSLLAAVGIVLLGISNGASAAERTVTLAVENMYCDACPYMVKKVLEKVSGVEKVTVSFKEKTAVVTMDDAKADVKDLTAAAAKAGYPSALKN